MGVAAADRRLLRPVVRTDLPIFFEQQRDPEATRMAVFPARDAAAFAGHWERILARPELAVWTIVADGAVAGYVTSFPLGGRRLVGYWIGREFWGRGLATFALTGLLGEIPERPLYAQVAGSNAASMRVLEKCGFTATGRHTVFDEALGVTVEEVLMTLPGRPDDVP
jgi:RimJ/RimL family protein N-acetyltransferase